VGFLQIRQGLFGIVNNDKVPEFWELLDLDFTRMLRGDLHKGFGKHADVGGGPDVDSEYDEEVLYAD
jgi:hypothetical protein